MAAPKYKQVESLAVLLTAIWLTPLLVALSISLVVCVAAMGTKGIDFPPAYLLAISKDLITFLGIITAILIAVFVSIYVQSRGNKVAGFGVFFKSLCAFKELIPEIDRKGIESNQGTFEDWKQQAIGFAEKLNKITPGWQGYDAHPKFECELLEYVNSSKRWTLGVIGQWENFSIRHDDHIKGILIGLRLMDEATVEDRLIRRLRRIFFSLVALLILSLLIRAISEPSICCVPVSRVEILNLVLYIFLPGVAIMHLGALAYAVCIWRCDMKKRDEAWAS